MLLSEVAERQVRAALAVLTGAGLTAEHAGDGEGTAVVIGRRCQG